MPGDGRTKVFSLGNDDGIPLDPRSIPEHGNRFRQHQSKTSAVVRMTWLKANSIYVHDRGADYAQVLFLEAGTDTEYYQECGGDKKPLPPPKQWITTDITPLGLPANTIAVDIGGIPIITSGYLSGSPDIAFAVRNLNDPDLLPENYIAQMTAARAQWRFLAPVVYVNGAPCISWAWLRGDTLPKDPLRSLLPGEWPDKPLAGVWPLYSTYGFNLTVQVVYCSS